MEAYQEKLFGGPEVIELAILDPRPDLVEDSPDWNKLLNMAKEKNKPLAFILHGFRCGGLRLLKQDIGYIMKPEFNKNSLWKNQSDYEIDREKWLLPHTQTIIELLNMLDGDKALWKKI